MTVLGRLIFSSVWLSSPRRVASATTRQDFSDSTVTTFHHEVPWEGAVKRNRGDPRKARLPERRCGGTGLTLMPTFGSVWALLEDLQTPDAGRCPRPVSRNAHSQDFPSHGQARAPSYSKGSAAHHSPSSRSSCCVCPSSSILSCHA